MVLSKIPTFQEVKDWANSKFTTLTEVNNNADVPNADKVDGEHASSFVSASGDTITGDVFIDNHGFGGSPTIALAIGDSDTGLNSEADGNLEFWSNATTYGTMNSGVWDISQSDQFIVPHMTADPSAQVGAIWYRTDLD